MSPFNKKSEDNWIISDHKFGLIRIITAESPSDFNYSLGWKFSYEPDALRNGIAIEVDVFGNVTYVGHGEIMEIIYLRKVNNEEGLVKAYKEIDSL